MKNLNLISSIEAHMLVNKAIDCTLESLKESPLQSIREAASYWEKKLGKVDGSTDDESEYSSRRGLTVSNKNSMNRSRLGSQSEGNH